MNRRTFLKATTTGALVSTTFAIPNIVVAQRNVQWDMATSWPQSLDTLYGGAE